MHITLGGPVVKELHLVGFCLFLIRKNLGEPICPLAFGFRQTNQGSKNCINIFFFVIIKRRILWEKIKIRSFGIG